MSKLGKRIQHLRRRLAAATPEQLTKLGVSLPADVAPARYIEVEFPEHQITVGLTPEQFSIRSVGTQLEVVRGRVRQHGRPVSNSKYLVELGLELLYVLLPASTP